ncbi:Pirin-like protein [Sesamum angolense]|uniref:Pirin-like protein n=1 Tax=Sesamum angolense TaxID=2727404 RepID=A0AAE1W730_9LAMI|nr:Pirin-like protein [Sesamum angolense]
MALENEPSWCSDGRVVASDSASGEGGVQWGWGDWEEGKERWRVGVKKEKRNVRVDFVEKGVLVTSSLHLDLYSSISETPKPEKYMIMSETDQSLGFQRPRLIAKKVLAEPRVAGRGAVVRRSIGRPEIESLDPFLLLDDFSLSPPAGFPDHPHRGFETVTYVLQWTTAGRGLVHSEMPAGEGTHTGLQLWINLASKDKMIEPTYQELLSDDIPKAEKEGVEVKVIAGEAMGVHSSVSTRTPTMYLDFTLKPNAQYHQSVPEPWNAFVYIIEGEGVFGMPDSQPETAHHILVLGAGGEGLSVWNKSSKPLRFILAGGLPLNEPVVQHGPFVMNTQAEIDKAIEDYNGAKNGFEMARQWRSK